MYSYEKYTEGERLDYQVTQRREYYTSKKKKKSENLADRLFDMEKVSIKQDQYTSRNNLEIHDIPVDVKNEQLEQQVIDIFSHLNTNISKPDIEDCHQLGRSNTIVRFVNRKVCKDALEKKFEVNRLIDNSKLGFKRESKLFIPEIKALYPDFIFK